MQGIRVGTICFLLAFSSPSLAGQASEPTERSVSLEQCIQMALLYNLDIQIQRLTPEIERLNLNAVRGAYDPNIFFGAQHRDSTSPPGFDPVLGIPTPSSSSVTDSMQAGLGGVLPFGTSYDVSLMLSEQESFYFDRFIGTTNELFSPGSVGLSVTQPLLKNFWIDGTRYQIDVSRKNIDISDLALQRQIEATITSVEGAYYNLIYTFEQVNVQEKAVELAMKFLAENRKRVEVGAMAPLDEKQAEADAAGRQADLLTALQSLTSAQNILKGLLTDDYSQYHTVRLVPAAKLDAFPVTLNLQESWSRALRGRADLVQARINLEKYGSLLKLQKNQLLPQLDLTGGVGYQAGVRSGRMHDAFGQIRRGEAPQYSFGGRISFPIGNTTARNNYRSSKKQEEQARLQLKQFEQSIMVEIDNAVEQVRTSLERIRATREARGFAEAAMDAEQKKLENGKSTSFEVLRLQRDLTSARSTEIRALADYNIALTELSFLEGTTLDRHNVSMKR